MGFNSGFKGLRWMETLNSRGNSITYEETVLRIWDMNLSLVEIHGFGSVIPVPINCRSHLFHVTECNVVCAGVIHVLVSPDFV